MELQQKKIEMINKILSINDEKVFSQIEKLFLSSTELNILTIDSSIEEAVFERAIFSNTQIFEKNIHSHKDVKYLLTKKQK